MERTHPSLQQAGFVAVKTTMIVVIDHTASRAMCMGARTDEIRASVLGIGKNMVGAADGTDFDAEAIAEPVLVGLAGKGNLPVPTEKRRAVG